MKAVFICLVALVLVSSSEALRCYACNGQNCSPRTETCGSLLQNPVCAKIESPADGVYMRGCLSDYVCRGYQKPGANTICCSYDRCN